MKRQAQVIGANKGVFHYSNGMIGTADLPDFIATMAYRHHHNSKKREFMLAHIPGMTDKRQTLRSQIARAYAQLKEARKHVH